MTNEKEQSLPERKVTITEGKAQPPDPMQAAAAANAAKKMQIGAAQNVPGDLGGAQGASPVLDTTPEREPYRTDDAKSSLAEILLVGGYIHVDPKTGEQRLLNRAVMREMSGHEEDMLTNQNVPLRRRFQNILAECLERIGDGEGMWITDRDQMHGILDGLTAGDRVQLLLHLRVISVYPNGEKYSFRVNCGNCGKEIRHTVDLTKCKHVPMPDPMKRVYDRTLPSSGKSVRCRVMLGRHESIIGEAQELGQNILSSVIIARVLEVNGKPASMASVKDLVSRDRDFLRQTFDEVEGGVDTTTMIQCGSCGARFEGEIDINQRDFFFPSGKPRN